MPEPLHGIGVSTGQAAGPAYRLTPPATLPPPVPVTDRAAELKRAVEAVAAVVDELNRRAAAARDPAAGQVLAAQAMMADDETLRDAIAAEIESGADAPHAIDAALAVHRQAFEAAGGYLAERVADLDDLRDRAVAVCIGRPMPGIPSPGHPFVLLARDLAPADTAILDPQEVLALVTEAGGPTSHTAILARSLGLPAVVRCTGALDIPDGVMLAVDGGTGVVRVGVDSSTVDDVRLAEARRRDRAGRSTGPGLTADGHPVALLANIGSARDLPGPGAVEGVGLFRTELLYLDRGDPPGRDEQVAAYAEVFAALPGRKVVVRTLDAGADKPLPFLHQDAEPNPALGIRGLRVSRLRPDVLGTQLAAIADAARTAAADVLVMAPMVATVAEAADFVEACRAAGLATAGVMVEVPAAALRAAALLDVVDFLSIGTNDLSQYTFAADRQCGDLADLLDPWQPALLELIAACASAGQRAGKPVGVCGEAAADPALALVLTGLGITSLSMSAPAVADVREALAAHSMDECRELAEAALAAEDARQAREAVLRRIR